MTQQRVKTRVGSAGDFLFSLALGMAGGSLCGAAILSFGALIGKSGSTGSEYVGYWEPAVVWLGLLYGGLFGTLISPFAYLTFLRDIPVRKVIVPAAAGTLGGGFVGALVGPPLALATGAVGFFVALAWTKSKLLQKRN